MQITKSILTKNSCYLAGQKITVKGLMLHSVGCSQPSASVFIRNWNNPSVQACVHGFIDANTGDVYQTLPWEHRGWHCGGAANNTHIGIEMCEPNCITYTKGASFTCSDLAKAKVMVERTYNSAVELFAYLCKQYGLDPLSKCLQTKKRPSEYEPKNIRPASKSPPIITNKSLNFSENGTFSLTILNLSILLKQVPPSPNGLYNLGLRFLLQ